jgi:hypothetical protein
MAQAFDVHSVAVALSNDFGGSNKTLYALRAPAAAVGGAITIVGAYAISDATLAAGTTNYYALALHRYDSDVGTTNDGTVAAAIGGTLGWTQGIPKTFTITASKATLEAGEWCAVEYTEAGTGNPTNGFVVIQYVMGK